MGNCHEHFFLYPIVLMGYFITYKHRDERVRRRVAVGNGFCRRWPQNGKLEMGRPLIYFLLPPPLIFPVTVADIVAYVICDFHNFSFHISFIYLFVW